MALTKAVCGTNTETVDIAGGQGTAPNPQTALIFGLILFGDALNSAIASLNAYAAQACPADCKVKTPKKPAITFANFNIRQSSLVPKKPARALREFTCIVSVQATVTFDCDE
jgi:hypothetical protein